MWHNGNVKIGRDLSVLGKSFDNNVIRPTPAEASPLGRLTLAGQIRQGRGVNPTPPWRVYGSYAVVYVLSGRGEYRDANGTREEVTAGDLIVVFPELPHTYGPPPGATWDECYLVFEGCVFDLWRQMGILDTRRPVRHLDSSRNWATRLQAAANDTETPSVALCRFLTLLTEMLDEEALTDQGEPLWLSEARRALESDLGSEVDLGAVAAQSGLSYENFRKRFAQQVGIAPAQYRSQRRMEAAQDLLRYTEMSCRQIAEMLGFADEFYFSRRFKQHSGQPPRAFRREGRR